MPSERIELTSLLSESDHVRVKGGVARNLGEEPLSVFGEKPSKRFVL